MLLNVEVGLRLARGRGRGVEVSSRAVVLITNTMACRGRRTQSTGALWRQSLLPRKPYESHVWRPIVKHVPAWDPHWPPQSSRATRIYPLPHTAPSITPGAAWCIDVARQVDVRLGKWRHDASLSVSLQATDFMTLVATFLFLAGSKCKVYTNCRISHERLDAGFFHVVSELLKLMRPTKRP